MSIFAGNTTGIERDRTGPPGRRRLRPAAEPLEGRQLMASGAVDPTFGAGGYVDAAFDLGADGIMQPEAVAVQADGKIVVAGIVERDPTPNRAIPSDFAVVRLDANGARDGTFGGGDGAVIVDLNRGPSSIDRPRALAIQADGKIVVAGTASAVDRDEVALVRLNAVGSLDDSFGDGGRAFAARSRTLGTGGLSGFPTVDSLAFQPDGRIILTGGLVIPPVSPLSPSTRRDYLARFDTSGGLDPTFSEDGFREVEGSSSNGGLSRVVVQPDGKIVRGGQFLIFRVGFSGSTSPSFAVERYNTDGSNDAGFGVGGRALVVFSSGGGPTESTAVFNELRDVALQADGKIVAVGSAAAAFAAARLNPDGSLDSTFDGDGRVTVTFDDQGGYSSGGNAVAIQPDGKLLLAGTTLRGLPSQVSDRVANPVDAAVVRLNSDGSLDPTFGAGGKTIARFLPGGLRAVDIATQPDGQLIVYGRPDFSFRGRGSTLVRLNGSGPPLVFPIPTPTVVAATPVRRRLRTSAVVVRFNTDLEPASANTASNYALLAVGRARRRGRPAPLRPLAISGFSYDAATRSATLTLAKPVLRNVKLRLNIAGANFFGSTGIRLAGSGGPGTDLVLVPVVVERENPAPRRRAGRGGV